MFSQGSRTSLSYVPETTFGVTPAAPELVQLPITTHSLGLTKDRVQGNDILPDRMPRVDRHGNRQVAGDIVADLRKKDYDPFIESAFMNTFSTNVIKIGNTPKSFSIEEGFEDISQYRLFTGCSVSQASFSIKPNQMITSTFSLVGSDMVLSSTSVDPTKAPISGNTPFDSYNGTLKISNSGSSLSSLANVTGLDFSINNHLSATFVVGSSSTPQLEYQLATVEGTLTAYFDSFTLYNRFLNEVDTALEVSVTGPSGVNSYTFLFPRVKFNTGDVPLEGPTSRVLSMSFVALYDSVENTNIKLTKTS